MSTIIIIGIARRTLEIRITISASILNLLNTVIARRAQAKMTIITLRIQLKPRVIRMDLFFTPTILNICWWQWEKSDFTRIIRKSLFFDWPQWENILHTV